MRARQVQNADFERYDLILVTDWDNLALVQEVRQPKYLGEVRRLTEFCMRHYSPVVPDSYNSGSHEFDDVSIWSKTHAKA